jgi:hypothetical protein
MKRRVKAGWGFVAFETAWRTLPGYEVMNMMRKGQIRGAAKGDMFDHVAFVPKVFGLAA